MKNKKENLIKFDPSKFKSMAEYRRVNLLLEKMDSITADRVCKKHGWQKEENAEIQTP